MPAYIARAVVIICLVALTGLLAAIVASDARRRHIPNRLCVAIAALAILYWLNASSAPLPQLGRQFLLLLATCIPLLSLFIFRIMGGGDVKLIAALMLWLQPHELPVMIVCTSLTGALLGIGLLLNAHVRKSGTPTIPYGVAIAAGTVIALAGRLPALIAAIIR